LQSPAVITGLAVLFFILALNLSGVFEFTGAGPLVSGGLVGAQSIRQRRAVRHPRGHHRVAVHRGRSWGRQWDSRSRNRRC
jgi:hypothetical protein